MVMRLMPIAGMNNVAEDDALQHAGDSPRLFLRDALNVNISDTGRVSLRQGKLRVTNQKYKNLWQSSLHQDVFATLGRQLVKVNPVTWEHEFLADNFDDNFVNYQVVNNQVFISNSSAIFIYNGMTLLPLGIENPASPVASGQSQGGRLGSGEYVLAITYMRNGLESGLSDHVICRVDTEGQGDQLQGSILVQLPYCLDESVTDFAMYCTSRNGTELRKFGTYPISVTQVVIDQCDSLGRGAQFNTLSPMPSGKFMKYWQGRLITADKNILRFSQAMTYHLHDERHDFVLLPQRITFIIPVDNGIWVGQVDHVVFLSGSEPREMVFNKKTAHSPVPFSAIEVDSDFVGGDITQGGGKAALWLAENGYVLGTSSGQLIELHAGIIKGLAAKCGRSVRLDRRITTIVS